VIKCPPLVSSIEKKKTFIISYNLVGILILNLFVYKHLINRDQSCLIQTKFIIGMILASVTMVIAGIIENLRQTQCYSGI